MGAGMKRAKAAAQATRRRHTLDDGMEAVARNLREFGYPDVTKEMIRKIYDLWITGKRFPELPHGVIAAFAERQFDEHKDMLGKLSAN